MKNLFKRKNDAKEPAYAKSLDKATEFIRVNQMEWAKWLQGKSEKLPVKSKWALLFLFCAGISCLCVYQMAANLKVTRTMEPIAISQIRPPVKLNPIKAGANGITKAEYEKINAYRNYLDSLGSSENGRATYLGIMQSHPGLLDSIKILEQLYQSQFKK